VMEDINQLDRHLRRSLKGLQTLINDAVKQFSSTEAKSFSEG